MNKPEFVQRVEDYQARMYRVALTILGRGADAEDAVQDTFLKAYRRMDGLRDEGSERAWLMSIAINTCRDYLRTAWLRHIDRRVSLDQLPEGSCDASFGDETVLQAVMALPPRLREAVLLRYYKGMKLREVAGVLGIGLSTVKQRLDRANGILRARLERWYFDEE